MLNQDQFLAASSTSPPSVLPFEYLQANLSALQSTNSCLQFVATKNSNIILLHYYFTGRMNNRRPQEDKINTLKMVFIAASCLIVAVNLLVLLAIVRKLRARRWVYSCIASITFSDLLAGVAYAINIFLSGSRTFHLSPAMWFLREGILFVALAASIFSLLVTAVERYSAMVRPIAENEASKTVRLRSLIISCWVLALFIGLLPLMGWNCLCNLSRCSTLLPLYAKTYILFSVVLFSLILVGIIGFYACIYYKVWSSARQATSRYGRKRSLRMLTTVLLILGAFIVCWIPLFILLLMDMFSRTVPWKLQKCLGWALTLAVANSLINPIIYSFRSQEVRRAIMELLCCCCVRFGLQGPRECLVIADIPSASSTGTENSLKVHESFRNSMAQNMRRIREPLSSNSSMLSTATSDHLGVMHEALGDNLDDLVQEDGEDTQNWHKRRAVAQW